MAAKTTDPEITRAFLAEETETVIELYAEHALAIANAETDACHLFAHAYFYESCRLTVVYHRACAVYWTNLSKLPLYEEIPAALRQLSDQLDITANLLDTIRP
jgi:hypothetical protein